MCEEKGKDEPKGKSTTPPTDEQKAHRNGIEGTLTSSNEKGSDNFIDPDLLGNPDGEG